MEPIVHQFPPYRESHAHQGHDDHGHHEDIGFLRSYIFSTDHKIIGIQYGLTALCFMLFGFFLMILMRWQIAHPGQALPFLGALLHSAVGEMAPAVKDTAGSIVGYSISPELY